MISFHLIDQFRIIFSNLTFVLKLLTHFTKNFFFFVLISKPQEIELKAKPRILNFHRKFHKCIGRPFVDTLDYEFTQNDNKYFISKIKPNEMKTCIVYYSRECRKKTHAFSIAYIPLNWRAHFVPKNHHHKE